MQASSDLPRHGIQSFITAVGFPDSIDQVRQSIEPQDPASGSPATLVEEVLYAAEDRRTIGWSVPRWAMTGDIAFFYQTLRSQRVARKLSEQQSSGEISSDPVTHEYIEHARSVFDDYAGCVFAVGRVEDRARFEPKRKDQYWGDLHYAGICDVFALPEPIALEAFRSFITIRRQATITPLRISQFNQLRDCILARNVVPDWFRDAAVVALDGSSLDPRKWREYLADQSIRFVHETQLRDYFADGFLAEIADSPSEVWAECVCWRRGKKTGRADYIVRIAGKYIPVEAKLQIVQSPDLDRQIRRYHRIDKFAAYEGPDHDRFVKARQPDWCLLIDQSGVYLRSDKQWLGCCDTRPAMAIDEIHTSSAHDIRKKLLDLSQQCLAPKRSRFAAAI